jgi:hypothetical protein
MRSICSLICAVFFDIGVRARDVGLRLEVVVVADEILDRVVREEALHLAIELRGQRLVGREDQRRPLHGFDHLGHREGLSGTGDAEQHLVPLGGVHARMSSSMARGWSPLGENGLVTVSGLPSAGIGWRIGWKSMGAVSRFMALQYRHGARRMQPGWRSRVPAL